MTEKKKKTILSKLPTILDITAPEVVNIIIDSTMAKNPRVWVNVNGVCRLRACRIKNLCVNIQHTNTIP